MINKQLAPDLMCQRDMGVQNFMRFNVYNTDCRLSK